MKIGEDTKVLALLDAYPFLLNTMTGMSPEFNRLRNPLIRKTLGRRATLLHASKMSGIPFPELKSRIEDAIEAGEAGEDRAARIERLKTIIRDLHAGKSVDEQKRRFAELLGQVSPQEIAEMEQALMAEGMPEEEIKRLCDVHVQVMAQSFETNKDTEVPPGHPIHTYQLENAAIRRVVEQMTPLLKTLNSGTEEMSVEDVETLESHFAKLSEIEKHYVRKENQFFPVLERHDITAPSKVMWALHDDIRDLMKAVREELRGRDVRALAVDGLMLATMINDMIYKEEQILFPLSLETLTEEDWGRVWEGGDEIGYTLIEPKEGWTPRLSAEENIPKGEALTSLNTGALSLKQIDLLLMHLPIDVTFVDEYDRVRYYSAGKERIFPRSPGIIGRKVQNCHPPASVHVVEKIVDAFRSGEKDSAEFWIELGARFIHIRYFAVRDDEGSYRGTLEVSQDVTGIRGLEGERRLLDW